MQKIAIYILAGGQSSRFGRDKARVMVHSGEEISAIALIVHVSRRLSKRADRLTVVAETAGKYADLGLATLGDVVVGCGPIGGLQTALQHVRQPGWLLLVACDMVGVQAQWIDS